MIDKSLSVSGDDIDFLWCGKGIKDYSKMELVAIIRELVAALPLEDREYALHRVVLMKERAAAATLKRISRS